MTGSFTRRLLVVCRRKNRASFTRKRRQRKTSLSTRHWLFLILSISTLVGVVYLLTVYYEATLYYKTGR